MKPSRMMALMEICSEYHGAKLRKRLQDYEWAGLSQFLVEHSKLGHLEFEYAVNRWHLDDPRKPRHWIEMHELAMAANTRAHKVDQ